MNTSNLSYSVWGVFENKNKLFLKNLQKKLRTDFNGPKFPLHITLSSNFKINNKNIFNKMRLISKESRKFYIETNNFGYKKKFFQSIFVKVRTNNKLILQKKIIDKYLNAKKKKYFPHISLYYGNLPEIKKKKIIANLKKFRVRIKIKEIYLVKNDEKKLRWQIIRKYKI